MPGAPSGRDGQHGDLRHPGVRGRALGELLVGRVGARGGVGPRQRQLGGPQEAADKSVRASLGASLPETSSGGCSSMTSQPVQGQLPKATSSTADNQARHWISSEKGLHPQLTCLSNNSSNIFLTKFFLAVNFYCSDVLCYILGYFGPFRAIFKVLVGVLVLDIQVGVLKIIMLLFLSQKLPHDACQLSLIQ